MNNFIEQIEGRAMPRDFNAHAQCEIRNCKERARYRVQLRRKIYTLCEICYGNCSRELNVTVLDKIT